MILQIALVLSVFCLFYIYLGYPILLFFVSKMGKTSVRKLEIHPRVSILISAHNEEKIMLAKLENSLQLDYPRNLLQVIIISDASIDRTDEIVRQYPDNRVALVRLEERSGKTAGLNEAVPRADGELIVMTDANAMLQKDALKELVRNFSDPRVGFVTGWTRYSGDRKRGVAGSAGFYTRLENSLKTMESLISSCVGADGAILAIRKVLYEPLRDHEINDFVLPLEIVKKGYRGVFEAKAICQERASDNPRQEYRRQVRITNRTLRAIFAYRELLNPLQYGWFAVELLSHKLLRFLTPYFLLVLFVCTLFLVEEGEPYQVLLGMQGFLYTCAVIGFFMGSDKQPNRLIALCTHFLMVNVAYLGGWLKFLAGSSDIIWDK